VSALPLFLFCEAIAKRLCRNLSISQLSARKFDGCTVVTIAANREIGAESAYLMLAAVSPLFGG